MFGLPSLQLGSSTSVEDVFIAIKDKKQTKTTQEDNQPARQTISQEHSQTRLQNIRWKHTEKTYVQQ